MRACCTADSGEHVGRDFASIIHRNCDHSRAQMRPLDPLQPLCRRCASPSLPCIRRFAITVNNLFVHSAAVALALAERKPEPRIMNKLFGHLIGYWLHSASAPARRTRTKIKSISRACKDNVFFFVALFSPRTAIDINLEFDCHASAAPISIHVKQSALLYPSLARHRAATSARAVYARKR